MEYEKLLSLAVHHQYFNDGPAPGLTFTPTEGCAKLLGRFGLLFRTDAQGFAVFKDSSIGFTALSAKIPPDVYFDFLALTPDKEFCLYTALPEKKNDEVYLFSNQTINKKNTTKLITGVISAAAIVQNPAQPAVGIVRLRLNYRRAAGLTLGFAAPAVKWKYYVLANASRAGMAVDGKQASITFSKKEEGKKLRDAVITTLTGNYPAAVVSFFESDKVVALNSQGVKNIQLKNEATNSVIIKHLPNPSFQNNGVQIINLLY